jgi:aspartate aminotransferase
MGFGEAGLPAHPMLREALARAAGWTCYGPVAGHAALREAAAGYWARRTLIIISDEIYRDLVHANESVFISPAAIYPQRTVVTTGLSKNLALGGWRLGVARLPGGRLGRELRERLLGVGSEIWSAPAGPVQQAAALAFSEPPELTERIALSRRLHASVARAVAARFAAVGGG